MDVAATSAQFWQLLRQGESEAALKLYDSDLANLTYRVSKVLRAAYHCLRWLSRDAKNCDDIREVELLAAAEPVDGQICRAARFLGRLRWEMQLARALKRRDDSELTVAPQPADSPQGRVLLGLSLILLRLYGDDKPEKTRRMVAAQVMKLLGDAGEKKAAEEVACGHLLLWAAWELRRFEFIAQNSLADVPKKREFYVAMGRLWAKERLVAGMVFGAVKAMSKSLELAGVKDDPWLLALHCGMDAIGEGATREAIEWFAHHRQRGDNRGKGIFLFASALALLKNGQYHQGIGTIEQLLGQSSARGPLWSSLAPEETTAQLYFCKALALLAQSRDWSSGGVVEETAARNRIAWRELRATIQSIAEIMPSNAWQGTLLKGLLAYLDRSVFDKAQCQRFTAALTEGYGDNSGRLEEIDKALSNRARLCAKAVKLVHKREFKKLKELLDSELSSLGEAIPALLRVSVYMGLCGEGLLCWDPQPEIRRIPATETNRESLHRCILWLQEAQILNDLSKECLSAKTVQPIVSLAPLAADKIKTSWAMLALATIHALHGEWEKSYLVCRDLGGNEEPRFSEIWRALMFYLSYRKGDLKNCHRILEKEGESDSLPGRYRHLKEDIAVRVLLSVLESERDTAFQILAEKAGRDPEKFSRFVLGFSLWLIEKKTCALAESFLDTADRVQKEILADDRELRRTIALLSGLLATKTARYGCGVKSYEQLLAETAPEKSIFGGKEENDWVWGWARLFKFEAQVAIAAGASESAAVQWASVQRLFHEYAQTRREEGTAPHVVRAFDSLVTGLSIYLNTDMAADNTTLDRLSSARKTLALEKHANFLESIAAGLGTRKVNIEKFWQCFRQGDFPLALAVYQNELVPVFGRRLPAHLLLAVIVAQRSDSGSSTSDLLRQLSDLERSEQGPARDLFDKARKYVAEGDRILHLARLVQDKNYQETTEFVQKTEWSPGQPGNMPALVALAWCYALYKKKRTQEARQLGENMRQSQSIQGWIKDYVLLLLGYVAVDEKNYVAAVDALGKVSQSRLLGHDVDKCWAVAIFSLGMEHLRLDKKKDAFDAFAQSLEKRVGAKDNARLVPLFMYFGVANIESQNGSRALKAFDLIEKIFQDLPPSPEISRDSLLAGMGKSLCKTLMDEDTPTRDSPDELLARFEKSKATLDGPLCRRLERALRILAICRELRREAGMESKKRKKPAELAGYLQRQIAGLEKIDIGFNDPVLPVLKAALALYCREYNVSLEKQNLPGSLSPSSQGSAQIGELLQAAVRLGVDSGDLCALWEHRAELRREVLAAATIDMFDVFLDTGEIPPEIQSKMVRKDDVEKLRRAIRYYLPADFPPQNSPGYSARKRMEKIHQLLGSEKLKGDKELAQLREEAGHLLKNVQKTLQGLSDVERQIVAILAQKMQEQAFG